MRLLWICLLPLAGWGVLAAPLSADLERQVKQGTLTRSEALKLQNAPRGVPRTSSPTTTIKFTYTMIRCQRGILSGILTNASTEAIRIPDLSWEIVDATGRKTQTGTTPVEPVDLAPGQSGAFQTVANCGVAVRLPNVYDRNSGQLLFKAYATNLASSPVAQTSDLPSSNNLIDRPPAKPDYRLTKLECKNNVISGLVQNTGNRTVSNVRVSWQTLDTLSKPVSSGIAMVFPRTLVMDQEGSFSASAQCAFTERAEVVDQEIIDP